MFGAEINQESNTNIVELPEEDPYLVDRFVDFLYTRKYWRYKDDTSVSWERLALAAGMDPAEAKTSNRDGKSSRRC